MSVDENTLAYSSSEHQSIHEEEKQRKTNKQTCSSPSCSSCQCLITLHDMNLRLDSQAETKNNGKMNQNGK